MYALCSRSYLLQFRLDLSVQSDGMSSFSILKIKDLLNPKCKHVTTLNKDGCLPAHGAQLHLHSNSAHIPNSIQI